MKKVIIFIVLLFLSSGMYAAKQLHFRFANPRIIRLSAVDHLQFDVQVKCDEAGTFLWTSTVKFNFNNTTFNNTANNWVVTKVGEFNTLNSGGAFKYGVVKTVTGAAPNKVYNIALTGDVGVFGNGPSPEDFTEMPTEWTTMITVSARLLVVTGDALAGLDFLESGMNNFQDYITAPSTTAKYLNPNIYDPRDFLNAYTGRFYSTTWGWSQLGSAANNVQFLSWGSSKSTTVWEGTADPGVSPISPLGDNTAGLINNLRVEGSSTLLVNANKWLTIAGATYLDAGCYLDIKNTGSVITSGAITGTGNSRIDMETPQNKWHFITQPVSNALTADVFNGHYLCTFNTAGNVWNGNITDPDYALTVMKGYDLNVKGGATLTTFTGTPNTGDLNISCIGNANGYNLVGNPYPSAIDLNTGTVTWPNGAEKTAWFWNPGAGGYRAYTAGSGGTHTQYAPAMQGFFVRKSTAGDAIFGLANSTRVHNTEAFVKSSDPENVLFVKASSGMNEFNDELMVRFMAETTTAYDPSYDATKLVGLDGAPQISTVLPDNETVTLNAQPFVTVSTVIPMEFSSTLNGTYDLTATKLESFKPEISITLEDLLESKTQDLRANPVYTFNHASSNAAGRFLLHFNNPTIGITDPGAANALLVYGFEKSIYVKNQDNTPLKGEMFVFNLLGQKVCHVTLNSVLVSKTKLDVISGYYIVKVISDQETVTKKIYLN